MPGLAGSAIKQGAGKLTEWDNWKPPGSSYAWLLVAGAMDPPKTVIVSKRRFRDARNGSFLSGIKHDMRNMEDAIEKLNLGELKNTIRDLDMEKELVKKRVTQLFMHCKDKQLKPILYYTGHGEICSGDWCFSDGTLSIQEIESLFCGNLHPLIISDCCFSGHWANYCMNKNIPNSDIQFHCLSASPDFSVSFDNKDGGGELTQWMTGGARPSTEPLYSGGNDANYPPDPAFIKIEITDFIEAHIHNNDRIVISQCISNNRYSVIFGNNNHFSPRPDTAYETHTDYVLLVDYLEKMVWPTKKNIFSLASDDSKFSVFSIENYGQEQTIVTYPDHEEYLNKGYRVTACCASGSEFYLVMTKEAIGFEASQSQTINLRCSQPELEEAIEKYKTEGKIITGLAYSARLKQYLVVMTQSTCEQIYKWVDAYYDQVKVRKWEHENFAEGFHTLLFFNSINTWLHFFQDGITGGFTFRAGYPIK